MPGFVSSVPEPTIAIGPAGRRGGPGSTGSQGPGGFVGTTVLTTVGPGTFTTSASTKKIKIRVQGGGGGGGGSHSSPVASKVSSGGGAGGYAEKTFDVQPSTGYAFNIGAAGLGGPGGVPGLNGGSSTFTVNGVTVTAPGGFGGPVALNQDVGAILNPGSLTPTGGDINVSGEAPDMGFRVSSQSFNAGGKGGRSRFGSGGEWDVNAGAANPAQGFGAGGSGTPIAPNNVDVPGGDGVQGVIIVEEYG